MGDPCQRANIPVQLCQEQFSWQEADTVHQSTADISGDSRHHHNLLKHYLTARVAGKQDLTSFLFNKNVPRLLSRGERKGEGKR